MAIKYIKGPVQTFTDISVLVTSTTVGFVLDTFGAAYLLIRARDGDTSNDITISPEGSIDGVNVGGSGSVGITGAVAGPTDGVGGLIVVVALSSAVIAFDRPIPHDFVKISATSAVGTTIATFDIWPVYAQNI